ncbi:hypothetical protein [Phytoactinopolyspora mesophila]|uniref:Uncharacterized protein n=1 Tax=Phytoactinopolyspora mesophila TaxID=2650750 RepID=A0A7K3M9H2_9ACTN|nr:hypothetical protein [Phytoactinopolyspora mesophila]NDL59916.1 hypothetical protein [Phytoactinopolyspora mesophila]
MCICGYVRRLPHRRRQWSLPIGLTTLALVLTACSGSDTGGTSTDDGHSALERSLGRIQATESSAQYIEFADLQMLDEVSGDSFSWTWSSLDGWGSSIVGPYGRQLPSVVGVDLNDAGSILAISTSPSAFMLVEGGQDEDEVLTTANSSGWSGEDILIAEENLRQPLANYIPQIKATGADAVLGDSEADLSLVDADDSSLADDPVIEDLAACLGDVVVGLITHGDDYSEDDTPALAAGVRQDADHPEAPVSILCVQAGSASDAEQIAGSIDEALSSGVHPRSGRSYSTYFQDSDVSLVNGGSTVKMVVSNTPEAFASTILQMTQGRMLPGVNSTG